MPGFDAELLLHAYAAGYFPMAETAESNELFWCNPDIRGCVPLAEFHVPHSLQKFLRKKKFHFSINKDFEQVIRACASMRTPKRKESWINSQIITIYRDLHDMGYAHSIECWHDNAMVGGLYGVALGGAFFGESMFSTESNASKAALVYLAACLKQAGYELLDAQFENPHLTQFGFRAIPQEVYLSMLSGALALMPDALAPAENFP